MLGNDASASFRRMSSSSTQPPYQPVSAPTSVPTTVPMATVPSAMSSVSPAPTITRLKMSRPNLSVPIGCAADGGSRREKSMALGE